MHSPKPSMVSAMSSRTTGCTGYPNHGRPQPADRSRIEQVARWIMQWAIDPERHLNPLADVDTSLHCSAMIRRLLHLTSFSELVSLIGRTVEDLFPFWYIDTLDRLGFPVKPISRQGCHRLLHKRGRGGEACCASDPCVVGNAPACLMKPTEPTSPCQSSARNTLPCKMMWRTLADIRTQLGYERMVQCSRDPLRSPALNLAPSAWKA